MHANIGKYNVEAIFAAPKSQMSEIIDIRDYQYDLPQERIAIYPLAERDQSKLLVYDRGTIHHSEFNQLPSCLADNTLLFFNDTKVIPARIFFAKETGAEIEIFLLSPFGMEMQQAMQAYERVYWKCTIGNIKRWKEGVFLKKEFGNNVLSATLQDRNTGIVKFEWSAGNLCFADVLNSVGVTPLPPYIKREAEPGDRARYQTIYSHFDGAVAAPTAGLHFTNRIIDNVKNKGVIVDYLTLHVSAGTFQPVKVQNALAHDMHKEKIVVTRKNLENLLIENKTTLAVGTTSLRTLESIYWYGVRLLNNPEADFIVDKMDPYSYKSTLPTKQEAILAVLERMEKSESLTGETSIYIVPGYMFKICDALLTNFHQPGSTLTLLVAAFVGSDWKTIYQHALKNQYRFLSYGDSSLLIPKIADRH